MSAVSSVSSPNYAQAVSSASTPGAKPPGAEKPKDGGSVAGATTVTKNSDLPGKLNVTA